MANNNWRNELYELAGRQHGVVELSQAAGLLGPRMAVLRELNGKGWRQEDSLIRVREGAPRSKEQAAAMGVLQVGPWAALGHASCAAWWDLPGHLLNPLQVIRLHGATTTRSAKGVRLRETRRLPESHVTVHKGIRVTRPERLPFDLIQNNAPPKVEVLVDRIIQRRLTTPRRLHQMLRELGGKGSKGIGVLRDIMADRPIGYVPPESGAESRMLWISRKYGLPEFRLQVNLGSDSEWVARVDFTCSERIVIWVQSEAYHSSLVDRRKDDAQRAKLLAEGCLVVEIWQHELWDQPEVVAQRVRDAVSRERPARQRSA